jgi:hypothetical protein
MGTTVDLARVLEHWDQIGGFNRTLDPTFSVSSCIDIKPSLEFGAIAQFARQNSSEKDKYTLIFVFALFALGKADMEVLRVWLAFALFGELRTPNFQFKSFNHFRQNQSPRLDLLMPIIKQAALPSEPGNLPRHLLNAANVEREEQIEADSRILVGCLLSQWPCAQPLSIEFPESTVLDVEKALRLVTPEWYRLYQNVQLAEYLGHVQTVLDGRQCEEISPKLPVRQQSSSLASRSTSSHGILNLTRDLAAKPGPLGTIATGGNSHNVLSLRPNGLNVSTSGSKPEFLPGTVSMLYRFKHSQNNLMPQHRLQRPNIHPHQREIDELGAILDLVAASDSAIRQRYGHDLKASLEAFTNTSRESVEPQQPPTIDQLHVEIHHAKEIVHKTYANICKSFELKEPRSKWLQAARLWPDTSTINLLELLRSSKGISFGEGMKKALVDFAVSLTQLQRLLRMKDAVQKSSLTKLAMEQKNKGYGNWQAFEHPDWVLFQLDANLLLRDQQITVARATINPDSGANQTLQLNMGEGKTACIIPIVAAFLADSNNLMRVVVPRSLLPQTATLLLSSLGGLVGRQIKHVPFSRRTHCSMETIKTYFGVHNEMRKSHGVMLTASEHILSFKLCGIQKLADGRHEESVAMVNVQSWLDKHSRDVVDECDYILSPKTALVFPSGNLSICDGAAHRWQTIEQVLGLVHSHLWNLQQRFPRSIEVISRNGQGFPFVFFLNNDVEKALISGIVADIIYGRTQILPTRNCTLAQRTAISGYISKTKVPQNALDEIKKIFPDKPELIKKVLLLRGLLVHRILLLALNKRFYVQYGLSADRDPIAVPFTAKGQASELAEFGHVDVSLVFTILASYYTGLDFNQVRQNLDQVAKSDDPRRAFSGLIQSCTDLPAILQDWEAINTDDETQISTLWGVMKYDIGAINYWLNHFCFPRHAKQFSMKMQTSAWDLLHDSFKTSKQSTALTTGFSGTNDIRNLLPLTITQHDLPSLVHTSAEVLSYLLQPRNQGYVVLSDQRGRRLSEEGVLVRLKNMGIHVLIDAGANILEMTNKQVAAMWLQIDTQAPAAVYFDEANKPFVLFRLGRFLPLSVTPFADDLSGLLVYIDQAHTLGTVSRHLRLELFHSILILSGLETASQCPRRLDFRKNPPKRQLGSSSHANAPTWNQSSCFLVLPSRSPPEYSRSEEASIPRTSAVNRCHSLVAGQHLSRTGGTLPTLPQRWSGLLPANPGVD